VLLHGFPEFWRTWRDYAAPLVARGYRVWLPDMRGYNLSDRPQETAAYHLATLADDIIGLFDAAGAEQAVLGGHDWGGVVAWQVALQAPERLRQLLIVNAPLPAIFARELLHNPAQREASRYIDILRTPRGEAVLAGDEYAALERMVLAPGLARGYFDEGDAAAYRAAWSQPGALTGMLNYYRAMPLEALDERRIRLEVAGDAAQQSPAAWVDHGPVKVPTLVCWGEQDTAILAGNLQGLDDHVPDLTLLRLPTATHWAVHEARAAILAQTLEQRAMNKEG
jgi:pimeloyl-ACP methyl ester carboxylesterase